ncbi:type II toxin-antitoxin system YafO family toxin [Raoultella ornithinolytica]|uniref:Type II toxin-antitoxin system YafO family toxin n=1 Tax=Raoultella ornithinolytica TaxID=54291 RepID=A0A9Q9J741_RAOOR|nr:type II toxin-antitoxin system YafO family toxin [Raoultella ornithinolytica]MCT4738954.1 type II toxin-antitoxin system YafO family toxin [Raoultella ornithinolytica]MEB7897848.1 type II toxin-antitoxin system YafO family toxin [Raoultella ornithinolytica]UXE36149.1 type II toxin-antitoxin system YafO family toxin [Raoultella ornithinolytica]WPO26074.1 type II toxin-antitoxin system YafO family toxin [Raoultella ornithinolytica]
MHVTVECNPQSYEYYLSPVFVRFPSLEASLLEDFRMYKATGVLPHYFGRDTTYDRPVEIQDSGLWHIHLSLGDDGFLPPPKNANLQDPKEMQWYRRSDTALVYAKGLIDENSYSLIAVFTPPAHDKANNLDRMKILAGYAREFSEKI